ncbi:succinate--hydroxymethylglutarate CoA-transferase-like isoform X1 [Limulus polyphemus]|uniref:Succinate--hydroxymethylglutarate CoA-transferase-like isoform X1 n=2 Tax=Limulus polyphemus TaxID=6850 RepID=A0ABM1C5B9_LIMPO|nr:succinate--hydroxymethylglutarate CoA-transferase-like isoform X1 [Limulus polyphemus]
MVLNVILKRSLETPMLFLRKIVLNKNFEFMFKRNYVNNEYIAKTETKGPLSGVRIIDLTRILAGPFCTMILGDLGAEVIKIEHPGGGDETRRWGPPFVKEESCYFLCVNRNKKSVAVNLKDTRGQSLVKDLAKQSDVLVENYLPGKLDELGLGFTQVSEVAPQLVYCSISGYGPSGPYKTRAGYDVIAASIGGLLHITGPPNGDPCKVGVAMTDLATGLYAHGAILAALLEREKTGRGQKIDCNLLSTQVSLLANLGSNYLNAGKEAIRWGTAHESIVPYQAFQTSDGYITVGAGSDEQFQIFCKCLGLQHLLTDSRYKTNRNRVANRQALLYELSSRFLQHSTDHWMEAFNGSGIPYGPINNIEQVFNDPQVQHNGMVVEMEQRNAGSIKVIGPAVKYSSSVNQPRFPPPSLGEHTDSILTSLLGLTEIDLQVLREEKVIS